MGHDYHVLLNFQKNSTNTTKDVIKYADSQLEEQALEAKNDTIDLDHLRWLNEALKYYGHGLAIFETENRTEAIPNKLRMPGTWDNPFLYRSMYALNKTDF